MGRFSMSWVPVVCLLAVACKPGEVGDDCREDDDCDVDAGLFCEKAVDATADDEGTCADEDAAA